MPSSPEILVSCHWVFIVKYRPDGIVDRYKACLVARSFTHTYGMDYLDTFSLVHRLNFVLFLFSMAINQQ